MECVEKDVKQFQNTYDLQMNSMKKQIDELYTTIKNDINSEAKQIEITLKNQLINANKSYMNKIEERFDKIEEYIFKWIGVEQLEEKFDKQLNSMKGDLIKLQTTLTSNVEEDVKLVEQSVKAYLNNENKEFINKTEERFQIIEDYLFKSIGLKQRQQQDKDVKKGRLTKRMIGNPIPFTITTPQADSNSKTVEFNITLPNDDVLRINISFVMMKLSEALETKDNDYLLRDQGDVTSLTTSTTISPPIETPTTQQQQEQEKTTEQTALKYFSVDDAIEAFRKSLINSEMDTGGILEAEKPFYRHFNLKYENVDVPIRCTYKSIYEQRELKINCFEYCEFEKERILSNGEIEKVRTPDLSRRLQDIQIVDLKDYTQTYKMNITVKCSYYSNYVYRKLNIYCFEFNDIPSNFDGYDGGGGGNQRENSNINERENQYEASPLFGRPDNDIYVRTIDINNYLQIFHMSIE
uniref:Uncharacterized protein n=1 Tax=Glossina pallidipes TaxID=7398 RepID=A0A1B0AEH8_GLOPL